MINPKNSLILAHTKLKSRKIRAIVTVVISSLLFSLLMLAVIVFEGVYNSSFSKFSKDSINSRNMVQAYSVGRGIYFHQVNQEQRQILDKMLDEEIAARKKRSKELGLEFDEKLERKNLAPYHNPYDDDRNVMYLAHNVITERFINDQNKDVYEKTEAFAKQLAEETNSKIFTKNISLGLKSENELFSQKDGKYQFDKKDEGEHASYNAYDKDVNFQYFSLIDREIYKHFEFNNHNWDSKSGKIPVLLPVNKLELLLGMKQLGQKSTLQERIARLEEVKAKAVNLEIKQCVLNSLAKQQHQEAILYTKKTKEEQKNVELVYGALDASTCLVPAVIKDTRSAETKKLQEKQVQFNYEFNKTPLAASAKEITFQVIGALPAEMDSEGQNFVNDMVQMMIGYNRLETTVPMDKFLEMSNFKDLTQNIYGGYQFEEGTNKIISTNAHNLPKFYFEYGTPERTREVIETKACDITKIQGGEGVGPLSNVEGCSGTNGFFLTTFGSRAADLLVIKEHLARVTMIVGAVFAVIAAIIMAGTVGRLISDSRRETAVFRAIGFKRIDISAVYINYIMLICAMTIAAAFGLAVVAANIINALLSDSVTAYMIWLYSPQDTSLKFNMIGFNWQALGLIAAGIVAVGLVSLIFPLLRNIRRNPIRDMRDDG